MFKRYIFLVFFIVNFCPVCIIYASSSINKEILLHKVKSSNLFLAKVVNSDESSDSNISDFSTFSEFSDLDDNDLSNLDIYDPFEKFNRKIFNFNLWLDKKVILNISIVYFYVVPKPIRIGFMNFVNNAKEPISIVNHLLQFKFISFTKNIFRFSINTILGCGGLVDVASTLNLPGNPNDLGYTLQYYHIGEGFYIFLPLLGPYTLKSGLSTLASGFAYSGMINNIVNINYLYLTAIDFNSKAMYYLENRKDFLSLISSTPDSYSLVKSAYIQNRMFNFNQLKSSW